MLAPESFTRARVWPSLDSAHRNRGRDPLKNFKGQHLKLGLKFYTMRVYNFGGSGRNLKKFYQRMWLIAGVIKWTLILQGMPPTKFRRVKNVGNPAQFLTTFEFDRKYLRNGSTCRKSEKYLINCFSSPIGRKKFGEIWSTNNKVIDAHVDPPNWTFFVNYISAPMGRWPLKFLHVLLAP